jgi:hypothetical protein
MFARKSAAIAIATVHSTVEKKAGCLILVADYFILKVKAHIFK